MKINKIIFAVNDSHYLDFWPMQAKICKEILNIEPVLFHITNENSNFYNDDHGLVKKIKKVDGINTGAQAAIGRMFFTKYFPEEVCLVADIDLISINKNYIQNQIKNFPSDSFIIYDSDAYDKKRPEADEYLKNEYLMGIKELFCYHANAGKGKTFNKLLNTDCTFEEYILRHQQIGNKDLFWGVDEYYFSKCILKTDINVVKLKRGFISPWTASKRIERHRFPVNLEWQGEIEAQQRDGIYNFNNLKYDNIIDINVPRPYSKYKDAIEEVTNIIYNTINNFDWGWMENLEVTNLKSLLVKEVFEDRIYERFFSVEEGDIVLDIGSSVGPFAYSILNKKPKHVYCLEPSSIEFSTLNKNLRGYPVTPINKGIGEHNNGFYSDVVFGEFGNEKTFIESINFSTLLKNYNLDKIDFFKIDCEGGEYHVFTPEHLEFLKTIPKITGEWHLQTEEEKSLFRNFRDNILPNFNNYEVYSVDDVNVKWDLWNEHFIEYYRQVIIHIDNR